MGNGNFRPPTESTPLNQSPKNCNRWLRRRSLGLCQIKCISIHGGLLGIWVKYIQNYFYLCLFLGTHLQVRPVGGFLRMVAQTMQTRARMCLLGIVHIPPHLVVQNPPKQFWGVNRRCQAKLAKSKNVHIIATTASIPTKFCTVMKTTKCPSWVVTTHALQIQDGGRPPTWKNKKNCYISAAVRAILTKFGRMMQFDPFNRSDR